MIARPRQRKRIGELGPAFTLAGCSSQLAGALQQRGPSHGAARSVWVKSPRGALDCGERTTTVAAASLSIGRAERR